MDAANLFERIYLEFPDTGPPSLEVEVSFEGAINLDSKECYEIFMGQSWKAVPTDGYWRGYECFNHWWSFEDFDAVRYYFPGLLATTLRLHLDGDTAFEQPLYSSRFLFYEADFFRADYNARQMNIVADFLELFDKWFEHEGWAFEAEKWRTKVD